MPETIDTPGPARRRLLVRIIPAIAIVRGGQPDDVQARLDNLFSLSPSVGKVWLLQEPRDPAVDRIVAGLTARKGPPRLSVVSADQPMGPWWPLMIAWFIRAPVTLLVAPEARLAPHFAAAANDALRSRRAVASPTGRRAGAAVGPGMAVAEVDAGEGAWLFDAQWIRHAWASPPPDLTGDPMPVFLAALARAGIGAVVPALVEGRPHLLGAAPA